MMLHALCDYYKRKSADPGAHMAPLGFEWKEIPFIIELSPEGKVVQIEDGESRPYLIPQGGKKSSNVSANLLWGNAEYVFGTPDKKKLAGKKGKGKEEEYQARLGKMNAEFRSEIQSLAMRTPENIGVQAVISFLSRGNFADLEGFGERWTKLREANRNVTFRLHGQLDLICQHPDVVAFVAEETANHNIDGLCLITGEPDEIERTHPPISGVRDKPGAPAQKNIVSVNDGESPAFASYHKSQGYNSPIGKRAAFYYTTALNYLLRKDSPQRLPVGDSTVVFWADRQTEFETGVVDIFGEFAKDDPDRNVRAVASLYKAIEHGLLESDEGNTRFFVLGLAPNSSRIAIRFWHFATVGEMAARIKRHLDDLAIERAPYDPPYLSLFRLLKSIATLNKADNIPPNLGGDFMRSILADLPYPQTLLAAAVRRIRAEHEVNYPRASLIKACINRYTRYSNPNTKEEIKMSLDESNSNVGYRLGRLFAVLERIQEEANGSATIRERYYGAASCTPVAVYPTLLKLKNHHIAKLESKGRAVNLEKLIGTIMYEVNDFPAQLSLQDQGRFAIGYYHQRQHPSTYKAQGE